MLSVLTHADPGALKNFVEDIIDDLGAIEVLTNQTALVMVPYRDTAGGAIFHLGEVLVAEARVSIGGGHEGYAACIGRDLEQALAAALLDAALSADIETAKITSFIAAQRELLAKADDALLRDVEATRVMMETF